MKQYIAVIDYGMGNIHSIDKALRFVSPGDNIEVVKNPRLVLDADKVVFPGVGAIRDCMIALKNSGLDKAIKQAAKEKPLLGICVGMQALFKENEEHKNTQGLGIISGQVKRLDMDMIKSSSNKLTESNSEETRINWLNKIKIPHTGWNNVYFQDSFLWHGIQQNSYFYFVHSYYCVAENPLITSATTDYGVKFDAAILSKNIFATQFHPEKSHKNGLQLLQNFCHWKGDS